ncbi:class I adenylate cyclase, partial [Salmonella enterica subsp. enterica serovar Kentucky]|nr:class I adenylate cyclase [Salmonella enterica subsp. enterica serovar Kentucky]
VDGFASEGIIQFFFEETGDEKGFNIYILDESNRAEVYHHCEGIIINNPRASGMRIQFPNPGALPSRPYARK